MVAMLRTSSSALLRFAVVLGFLCALLLSGTAQAERTPTTTAAAAAAAAGVSARPGEQEGNTQQQPERGVKNRVENAQHADKDKVMFYDLKGGRSVVVVKEVAAELGGGPRKLQGGGEPPNTTTTEAPTAAPTSAPTTLEDGDGLTESSGGGRRVVVSSAGSARGMATIAASVAVLLGGATFS